MKQKTLKDVIEDVIEEKFLEIEDSNLLAERIHLVLEKLI